MKISNVKFILTDIEGTTTSVSFVYDQLFPYFRNNIYKIKNLIHLEEVREALEQTQKLASEENIILENIDQQIEQLLKWSLEDKKITPLKTLQGILWEEGYASGEIKGHVYPDVAQALENWKSKGIDLGVFSSGSVAAQKLIFGYSVNGDLTSYFSVYFDTKTGGKREVATYNKIANILELQPDTILFLSDIVEELEAAKEAGLQTIQLVRPENTTNWEKSAHDFSEIKL
jgi:enolase-phosphatase E1